ncbi:glycosyltransferase family 2 protein [bacterium]|nr:glycosyltransferase family 2 protein [bacterium]
MQNETPLVSIIIANWNGRVHLEECLRAIEAQTYPRVETVMVDNASIDGSVEFIKGKFPSVKLILNDINRGFCASNNQGIRAAAGELLFLLNNDTAIAPDCVAELVACLKQQDAHCIGCFPKVVFYSEPHIINAMGTTWHVRCHWRDARVGQIDLRQFDKSERVFGSIFPAVLLSRDLFMGMGMFDEAMFSYCEDFDVCYRANALGYHFVTAPKSVVRHKYRSTAASAYRVRWQQYFFIRNYLYVFLKNYSLSSLVRHFPYACHRYLIKSAIVCLRNRDVKSILMHVRAVMFIVAKLPNLLKSRRFLQKTRKRRDEDIWSTANVEHRNLFHHRGMTVLSLLNVQVGLGEVSSYRADGKEYQVE